MPDWRIYYDGGRTYDSAMGLPHDAPPEGFIAAIGYDETGKRYIMQSYDFYGYDEASSQWWGCNMSGLLDRLRRNVVYAFKEGRTVTKSEYGDILGRAHADPDFPQRG